VVETALPVSIIGRDEVVPGPEYEKVSFGPTKAHMSRSLASSSSIPSSSSVGGGGGGGGGEGGGGEIPQSPLPDAPPSTVEVVEVEGVEAGK